MIWEIDDDTRAVEGLDAQGRAIPGYAASLGLLPARIGQRVLATACEIAIGLVLLLPLLIGAMPAFVQMATASDAQAALAARTDLIVVIVCAAASSFLSTVFIVVQLVLHGRLGLTVGKVIAGVRSVNVRTLERPGFWRGAVVRYLVLWASFFVPLAGPLLVVALSPLFDPQRRGRGWPDLAGATWFVDVRRGLNPYDKKRMRIARKAVGIDLQDAVPSLPSLATPADPAASAAAFPVARSTGGVLGAPRMGGPGAPMPAGPAGPVPAPAAPVAAPAPTSSTPVAHTPASASSATVAGSPAPVAGSPTPVAGSPTPEAWAPPAGAPAPAGPSSPASPPVAAPSLAADRPAGVAPAAASAVLVLDTGERLAVPAGGGILIGRAPAPADGDAGLLPVAIADDTKSVSKTHVAIRFAGGDLVVEDRHSTNGGALVRDGAQHELVPGRPTPVRDGDDIRFGDRHARIELA